MMQGYSVSSSISYDSDDYDDLLALSCDACSEQVRHSFPFFSQVMIDVEASSMHPSLRVTDGIVILRQPALLPRSCSMSLTGEETARSEIRKALCSDFVVSFDMFFSYRAASPR